MMEPPSGMAFPADGRNEAGLQVRAVFGAAFQGNGCAAPPRRKIRAGCADEPEFDLAVYEI